MAIEILPAVDAEVVYYDPMGLVPSSASAVLNKPSGENSGYAGTVTLPTATTTTASGTTSDTLVVLSTSGFSVGDHIAVTSDGVAEVDQIARINGTSVDLVAGLTYTPDDGSSVKALDMRVTISGVTNADIGEFWRLVWSYDDGGNVKTQAETVHIVFWTWTSPISAEEVRRHASHAFSSLMKQRSPGYWQMIADRANERVKESIGAAHRRPWLYGESGPFSAAARVWSRFELARDGLVPRGANPGIYQDQLRQEFNDELNRAMTGLRAYDANSSGGVDSTETAAIYNVAIGTR